VSDIDTGVVDSLKALDTNRPIREADIAATLRYVDDSASELTARRARGPQVLVDLDSLRQRRHPLELHGDHRLFLRSPVVGSASDPTPIAAKPS